MIKNAIKTIRIFLPQSSSVTHSQIEEAIDQILFIPTFSELDREQLFREISSIYNVQIDDFVIIERKPEPWIKSKEASINWQFWNRYRDYLESEKNFSPSVTASIDRLTNRTLDGLFDPKVKGRLDKRGIVVGQVQSGKTANYTGLVCKAADAGFDFILVLAGIHNNLRSQTQLRLDESFLGFDTQYQRAFDKGNHKIGVGVGSNTIPVHSLTSSDASGGDFSSRVTLSFATNEPIIGVVKKNQAVLKKVFKWLQSQAITLPDGQKTIKEKKLLLIDDEADNASISTIDDPTGQKSTKINGLIRDILRLFEKSGYVGYTATPFANIFIPLNEDNLFPRDFIVNLPAPNNYIGPNKVFGFEPLEEDEAPDNTLPIVQTINDAKNFIPQGRDKDLPMPTALPDSLKLAIKCFIITCAVRRLRGQKDVHNSMLIHVVRLINRQQHIRKLVEEVFNLYKRGIEMSVPLILEEFKEAFETDSSNYKSYQTVSRLISDSRLKDIDSSVQVHSWEDVLPHLYPAVAKIEVKDINGGSADILNYYDRSEGLSVIAIGGDKLSRGLTLEGLSVSYFLRASKMYDTLLQMGRWFGYRGGYMDLCRLFTSRELNEWFCHITKASEDLREQFDYMADVAGSTPERFALGVKTHPGVLQISASNKMRLATIIKISWSGKLIETYEFQKKPEVIKSNVEAVVSFINSLDGTPMSKGHSFVWYNVSPNLVLEMLNHFTLSENLKSADPVNLTRFINNLVSKGELTNWSVALISKGKTDVRYDIDNQGQTLSVGCVLRNENEKNSDENIYFLNKSRIASPTDELIDLPKSVYDEALRVTEERAATKAKKKTQSIVIDEDGIPKEKSSSPSYPNTQIVRNEFRSPQNPLLLIYLLDPIGVKDKNGDSYPEGSLPIAGYAISFPKSEVKSDVEFAVHEQLLDFYNVEDNEDEEIGDDE